MFELYGNRPGFGTGALGAGGGPVAVRIDLSSNSILESASIGTAVGALSVFNGSGTYTFSVTADPSNLFDVSASNLITTGALDYESAASHSVTIQADNGVDDPVTRTFSISVTNVFEAVTLSALALSVSEVTQDVAATVNITGAAAGSVISGTVPDGMTLNSAARTITGTPTTLGTFNFGLTETLDDSPNSPNVTNVSLEVVEAPPVAVPTVAYIAADGAWSPHYNAATAPTATFDPINSDRILYAYEAGEVGTLTERKAMVTERKGSGFTTSFVGDRSLKGDDHGVPSIVTHPTNGRAYVYYGSHNYTTGSFPGQPFAWEITPGAMNFTDAGFWPNGTGLANDGVTVRGIGYAYPHPMFVGSELWITFRSYYDNFYGAPISKMPLSIRRQNLDASGLPTTLGAAIDLIDCGDLNGIDGFGAGSRVYHGQNIVKDGEIYMPVSITDSGDSTRRQPGVVVYNPATGTLRNVEGTFSTTSLPINYATYKANFVWNVQTAADYSSSGDIAFDTNGFLHHIYRRGTSTGSLTFYHRYWNGSTISAEVSTGVVVDNEFDHMAIAPDGSGGLEALYVQDPLAAYAREGEVWRKTWTAGGGWTDGALILDDDVARPGRGRPMAVYGKPGSWVMAEKSPGTTATPGNAFYGQHRCWLYVDGDFVNRPVASPTAPTPYAPVIRAGTATGQYVGYMLPLGDTLDRFPKLSLANNAGGQFALSDDDRRQFPNIVTTSTPAVEGTQNITVRATNVFGETTDLVVPVTVRAASTFEPDDLAGTKSIYRATDVSTIGINTIGSFVQGRPGDLAYRFNARNNSDRIQAGSTTDFFSWFPYVHNGTRGYLNFASEISRAASASSGAAFTYTSPTWLMGFCVRIDSTGAAEFPTVIGNAAANAGGFTADGRFSLHYSRAANLWMLAVGRFTRLTLPGSQDVDQVVMIGQTSAGNYLLRVGDTEVTGALETITGGSPMPMFGKGTTSRTLFKGRCYAAVFVKDALPDATARGSLKTWLETA